MIRIVLDTNILVSALLQPESLPAAVLMLALSGEVQICVSDAVFAEYDEVIRRPHFKAPAGCHRGHAPVHSKAGPLVKPGVRVDVCTDPTITFFSNAPKPAMRIIW